MKWPLDTAHSSAEFAVKHMGLTTVRGRFEKFEGSVDIEDGQVKGVEAKIDVQSINTREEKRDVHLRSGDFFLADEHPHISFQSKRVEHVGGQNYRIVGDIEIRGVRKEITLDAEISPVMKNPWGIPTVALTAEGSIDRTEFGVNWNVPLDAGNVLVGHKVKLMVEAEVNDPQAVAAAAAAQQ